MALSNLFIGFELTAIERIPWLSTKGSTSSIWLEGLIHDVVVSAAKQLVYRQLAIKLLHLALSKVGCRSGAIFRIQFGSGFKGIRELRCLIFLLLKLLALVFSGLGSLLQEFQFLVLLLSLVLN